jgi:glycosyltransferase involved in cell wall biosynthesis
MWNPAAATIVREHPTSVVVAEHSQAAVYRPRSRAYVLHLQNADVVRLREQPRSPHLVPRMHQRWELATLPAWERRAVRDPLARVVAVSRADAEALGLSATVIPNGTRLHPPRQLPPGGGVLFVGALDYMPNEAGLTWWAENVWPKLPSGFPPLTVVGRGGRSALGRLSNHPGLDVVGEVSDLVPFYQQAALVVVPLLHGSGTRLKVLEAMAWSVPVLSTTKGAEGLDLVPNRDFAVADTAMEFARRAVALMSDLEQRRSLGLAGRTAAEPYSWSGLGEALRDLVRKVDADLRA